MRKNHTRLEHTLKISTHFKEYAGNLSQPQVGGRAVLVLDFYFDPTVALAGVRLGVKLQTLQQKQARFMLLK